MSIEIVSDPDVLGGRWRFEGTRIPVDIVRRIMASKLTRDQRSWIKLNYPTLTDAHIDAALAWTFPPVLDKPFIESATYDVVCVCGETTDSLSRDADGEMSQCPACAKRFRVAIAVEEITP